MRQQAQAGHVTGTQHTLDERTLLHIAGRWLKALTEGSREVVTLVDARGRLQFMSVGGAVQELVGYEPIDLAGKDAHELVHPDDLQRVLAAFAQLAASTGGAKVTAEYRLRRRGGEYVRLESTAVNRLDDPIVGAIVVHTRAVATEPSIPAPTPSASGDHERGRFIEAVAAVIAEARINPSFGFSVLSLEIERFKSLAGTYGERVVEGFLAEAQKRIAALVGPHDRSAWVGPGELAILLSGVGDRRRAARIAERAQEELQRAYQIDGRSISVLASVGIATSERQYEEAEQVVRDAQLAAAKAQSAGGRRRRAVFQTQMRVEDTRMMTLMSELHAAVQQGQLVLHYQPLVSLATRTLVGFEALVRWNHPRQGMVPPIQFIPLAEDTGLIVPMGKWVLEEACRQMAEWQRTYPVQPPLSISVNLSTKQLAEEDLSAQLEGALQASGLDPLQLKLELTESAVLAGRDEAAAQLARLKSYGVRLVLDDFGTGYSSFSYLHQLPYDTLKIDRSFVSRIGDRGENCEIIHAIIVLAHNLRMDVVAEGVETAAQASHLKNMWCEYGQGYFFAKPLDPQAAGTLIATWPEW